MSLQPVETSGIVTTPQLPSHCWLCHLDALDSKAVLHVVIRLVGASLLSLVSLDMRVQVPHLCGRAQGPGRPLDAGAPVFAAASRLLSQNPCQGVHMQLGSDKHSASIMGLQSGTSWLCTTLQALR